MAKGSIKQRGPDSYSLIAPAGRDPETGKPKQTWRTVKRLQGESNREFKRRAEEELSKLMASIANGASLATGRATVSDYFAEWMTGVRLNVAPRTAAGYEASIREHVNPVIGSKELRQVRPADLERIYSRMAEKGLTGNTRLHVHRMLSKAFKEALRRRKLAENPCSLIDAPRVSKFQPHELTADEARRLIAAGKATRSGVLIELLASTGLRLGEALGLRWEDIDLEAGVLNVRQTRKLRLQGAHLYGTPKTARSTRSVDLFPALVTVLEAHRRNQREDYMANGFRPDPDFVFTVIDKVDGRETVTGMGHDHAYHDWKITRAKAGVSSARIHDLRHFAATTMLAAGVPVPDVSAMLGHSTATVTLSIYAHVVPGRGKAAVAEIGKVLGG